MNTLRDLIANSEDWLVERVLVYAKRHGYTQFSSTLAQPWRESICGFSQPLLWALEKTDEPDELAVGTDYAQEPIAGFALSEARLHRERGVPLSLFLGLTKYYRQAYLDLILEQAYSSADQERYRLFVERFFDHIEIAFCTEWSAIREAELLADVQSRNRLLTNEKNKYLTILESMTDPVILIDEDGGIENLNFAAAVLFDEKAVPGQGYYADQCYPLLESQLDRLVGTNNPGRRFEHSIDTAQGPREFDVKTQPMLDVSEKFVGTVLILSDVTEYKRARQEADAASLAKSTFLATMSHEVRTPITGILGIAHLLQDGPLTDVQSRYVAALISSGEVLLALVNDVLDYSKIEAGTPVAENRDFDLSESVEQVCNLGAAAAGERGLKFTIDIEDDLPARIKGDEAKVRRILLNLVTNAVKFTPEGSVTVSLYRVGSFLRCSVTDTGIGISRQARPKLFQPFVQHPPADDVQSGGTGLGLAICKKLASAIGGEIGFESREGSGSTFWFQFPLSKADAVSIPSQVPGEQPPLSALRVLLVEDNAVNKLVAKGFLERDGHQALVVDSGEAALETLSAEPVDLVLMDVRMRGMGGLAAIGKIRSLDDPKKASVPILVLTADLATTQERACLESGADNVLGKPFDPSGLRDAIARCLARAKERRAADSPFPADQGKVFDKAVIARHRDALGTERTRRIVDAFHDSVPVTMDAIRQAVERGDVSEVSDLAHALKSAAGNLGLERLRHSANALETTAGTQNPTELTQAVEQICDDFDLSVAALQAPDLEDLLRG
ncbi:ATP-binding protein [Pelagibius sp.]|uniref:ATP-binding protein n=1 Tax=Pelagibius sp. TaxID=1931238 RepID=UPI003BB15FB0